MVFDMSEVQDGSPVKYNSYKGLARKYRPAKFSELIGQGAVVATLSSAIESERVAQAYMLTGIRGTGKTTIARLIARALNCVGPDGFGQPTASPCGICDQCEAIANDRHVDVLEVDAASRTGVDDMRELLTSVRYLPTSGRFKVYIIDEVHMLSNQAFNSLLKTLEEPPSHVKFVFATTEIRKIPMTVVSRCQRFDLRRIDLTALQELFSTICEKENVKITDGALSVIAQISEGSARDGLSILDRVISQMDHNDSSCSTDVHAVQKVLGLADRSYTFNLLENVLQGNVKAALNNVDEQFTSGIDPIILLKDLLELTHWLVRTKVSPDDDAFLLAAETDRVKGKVMAKALSMTVLSMTWQMLLKGLKEAEMAPLPVQAVEMTIIRIAYLSELPNPSDVLADIKVAKDSGKSSDFSPAKAQTAVQDPVGSDMVKVRPNPLQLDVKAAAPSSNLSLASITELVDLCKSHKEMGLSGQLINNVHIVDFEYGKIDMRLKSGTPAEFVKKLSHFVSEQTGINWRIRVTEEGGGPTIHETNLDTASVQPTVKSILESFPGAKVQKIRQS